MGRKSIKLKLAGVIGTIKNTSKFLVKNISPLFGSFLLLTAGSKADQNDYKKRILVVFGGGIGDVAKRSIVCEYTKRYLAAYDVYYLMPYEISFPYAKETIHFDYTKAKIDPGYYFRLVNKLRRIGFGRVIVLFPAWEGFLVSLGGDILPETLYRQVEVPPKELLGFASSVVNVFKPRLDNFHDISVISYFDKRWTEKYFPSDVYKTAQFFSKVICDIEPDRAQDIDRTGLLDVGNARTEVLLEEEGAKFGNLRRYCVIGLGSSSIGKNWPPEKFGQVAGFLSQKGIAIVLAGGPESIKLKEAFKKTYQGPFLDLINKTSLNELCRLINGAAVVVSNDTSFVHLGIAFKKPTVCVCYGKQIGADSCYGYEDINYWIFSEDFDKIEASEVSKKLDDVLSYADKNGPVPKAKFTVSFFEQKSS